MRCGLARGVNWRVEATDRQEVSHSPGVRGVAAGGGGRPDCITAALPTPAADDAGTAATGAPGGCVND